MTHTQIEIATGIVGAIEWRQDGQGYCECPGKRFHTKSNGNRDCRVYLDDGIPTISCFHSSCKGEVDAANHALRSAIAKAEFQRDKREPGSSFTVRPSHQKSPPWKPHASEPAAVEIKPGAYDVEAGDGLPKPIEDGTRKFLRAVFGAGDGVQIAGARLSDDGREVPDGDGITLSRDEWIRKLDEWNGDPNCLFHSPDGLGIYVRVNPMREGGRGKDEDVADYRHALIEFDNISLEQQWRLYQKSGLPCAAVILSGGKSVHAWVKIGAKNLQEYRERVDVLHRHFEQYKPDPKNRNPSRFSRLPNCRRFSARQELLAVDMGEKNWAAWMKRLDNDSLEKPKRIKDYLGMDPWHNKDCVIGFKDYKGDTQSTNYLCKGKAIWLVGPSGIGKSSLITQMAICFAQGNDFFGVTPVGKLKILIIQAENDDNDIAEMIHGISKAMNVEAGGEKENLLHEQIMFITKECGMGQEFLDWLSRILERDKPDLVIVDPLLAFAGININDQKECTWFTRQGLNPILKYTDTAMICAHHTGKPKTAKETAGLSKNDLAYAMIGSSDLTNWARGVINVRPVTDDVFELIFAKRGKRAVAKKPNGEPALSIWIRHAATGITWEQIDEPAMEVTADSKPRKQNAGLEIASLNLHSFIAACPAKGERKSKIATRLYDWLCEEGHHFSEANAKSALGYLISNKKLAKDGELYIKGPNA